MGSKQLLAVATCVTAVAGVGASGALAGEVTGRPGTANVPFSGTGKPTGAVLHANSACAFSGLNDMNPAQGPIDFHVQSPGQGVRNGAPPGLPGHGGVEGFENGCRGFSNPYNPPS